MYHQACDNPRLIAVGHCEPLTADLLPKDKPILLLIRDPRDIAISAVDYIDKFGLRVWPGLSNLLSTQEWQRLPRFDKVAFLLEQYGCERQMCICHLLESAVALTSTRECVTIRYEDLSPETTPFDRLHHTLAQIGLFFDIDVDEDLATTCINNSFRNRTCHTLIAGKTYRYLAEDREIIDLLNDKLQTYIDYFGY